MESSPLLWINNTGLGAISARTEIGLASFGSRSEMIGISVRIKGVNGKLGKSDQTGRFTFKYSCKSLNGLSATTPITSSDWAAASKDVEAPIEVPSRPIGSS